MMSLGRYFIRVPYTTCNAFRRRFTKQVLGRRLFSAIRREAYRDDLQLSLLEQEVTVEEWQGVARFNQQSYFCIVGVLREAVHCTLHQQQADPAADKHYSLPGSVTFSLNILQYVIKEPLYNSLYLLKETFKLL